MSVSRSSSLLRLGRRREAGSKSRRTKWGGSLFHLVPPSPAAHDSASERTADEAMARRPLLASLAMLCLVLVLLVSAPRTVAASSSYTAMSYCRCTCFNRNSTIIPLYRPANPANPCLTCTRQFCLDQKLPACVGAQNPEEDPDTATGIGSDVEARCFRKSGHPLYQALPARS